MFLWLYFHLCLSRRPHQDGQNDLCVLFSLCLSLFLVLHDTQEDWVTLQSLRRVASSICPVVCVSQWFWDCEPIHSHLPPVVWFLTLTSCNLLFCSWFLKDASEVFQEPRSLLSDSFVTNLVFHASGMGESPKLNSLGSMDFILAEFIFNSVTVSTKYTWATTAPVGRAVYVWDSFLSRSVKLLSMGKGGSTTSGTSTTAGRLVVSSASTIRILLPIDCCCSTLQMAQFAPPGGMEREGSCHFTWPTTSIGRTQSDSCCSGVRWHILKAWISYWSSS